MSSSNVNFDIDIDKVESIENGNGDESQEFIGEEEEEVRRVLVSGLPVRPISNSRSYSNSRNNNNNNHSSLNLDEEEEEEEESQDYQGLLGEEREQERESGEAGTNVRLISNTTALTGQLVPPTTVLGEEDQGFGLSIVRHQNQSQNQNRSHSNSNSTSRSSRSHSRRNYNHHHYHPLPLPISFPLPNPNPNPNQYQNRHQYPLERGAFNLEESSSDTTTTTTTTTTNMSLAMADRNRDHHSTASLLDSMERRTQRTYRYGIGLVCVGATLNWLGFAQGHGYVDPLRYLGVACVISGSFCVCLAMCRWLGRPISVSSHRVNGLTRIDYQDERGGRPNDVHVINVSVPMYVPPMHEEYRPTKPPTYEEVDENPPDYETALKLSPGHLFTNRNSNVQTNSDNFFSCGHPSPSHSHTMLTVTSHHPNLITTQPQPQSQSQPQEHQPTQQIQPIQQIQQQQLQLQQSGDNNSNDSSIFITSTDNNNTSTSTSTLDQSTNLHPQLHVHQNPTEASSPVSFLPDSVVVVVDASESPSANIVHSSSRKNSLNVGSHGAPPPYTRDYTPSPRKSIPHQQQIDNHHESLDLNLNSTFVNDTLSSSPSSNSNSNNNSIHQNQNQSYAIVPVHNFNSLPPTSASSTTISLTSDNLNNNYDFSSSNNNNNSNSNNINSKVSFEVTMSNVANNNVNTNTNIHSNANSNSNANANTIIHNVTSTSTTSTLPENLNFHLNNNIITGNVVESGNSNA